MSKASKTRLKPPENLRDEELLEWGRITSELRSKGILDKTDRAKLVLYVQAWSAGQKAAEVVHLEGPVKEQPNGATGPHPALRVQLSCSAECRKLMDQMGLGLDGRRKAGASAKFSAFQFD